MRSDRKRKVGGRRSKEETEKEEGIGEARGKAEEAREETGGAKEAIE